MSLPSEEQWRPIPGYEGVYEASDRGRVRSLHGPRPLVLCAQENQGYLRVRLHLNGWQRRASVHSLVLLAFVGLRPRGLLIRHLDGDSLNNRRSNLAYGTQSENELDKVRHGTHSKASRLHCPEGHALTGDNVLFKRGGKSRQCRTCNRDRAQARRDAIACDPERAAAARAKHAARERVRYAQMRAAQAEVSA